MHAYISSTMGFRYRGSLSFHDFYFLNERTECPSWGGPISVAVGPRFLYGLRQSTLIQWSASRRLILGGNYGNAYCRLVAPTNAPFCDRGCQFLDPLNEKRRKRVACKVWKSDGCISDGDESVDEMLSLMTDVISAGSRKRNGRVAAESVGKTEVRRCCDCQKEKEVRVDDRSKREVKYVESGLQGRKSKGQIKINADEGYRRSRIQNLSRDDNRAVRKGGSSSSYYSRSSSGDFGSNIDEAIRVKWGNVFGESSSSFKNDSRFERTGVCEEEVKQIQEYGDDRRHMESSTKRNAARVSMEQGDRVRLNVTDSCTNWGLKRESEKLTEMSELQESDIQRSSSSENHSKMRGENRQEILTSSIDSVHREREQFTQKVQQITRQKESGRESHVLDRISKMNEDDSKRVFGSQKKFDARTQYREEDTGLDVNLIEEGRTHHRRIDWQDIRQTEIRNQSQKLTEESEIYDIDIERASSSQKVFKTRVSDREENSTLLLNSVHEAIEQCSQTYQQAVQESREQLTLTDQQALQEARKQHFQKNQEVREQHTLTGQQVAQKVRDQHIQTDQQVVQEMREQCVQADQKAAGQIQMRKESRNIDMSRLHSSVVERASSSQRVYKMGTNNQEETLTSVLNMAQEDNMQQYQTDEQIIRQDSLRKESDAEILESRESDIERASREAEALLKTRSKDQMESSTLPMRSVQGARQQQIGMRIEENTNSLVIATPPRSQMVLRGSMPEAFSETIVSSSGVLSTRPEGNVLALHESDERTRTDDLHDDALGSASRLEASSAQFFGEFVDKIQQGVLIVHESSSTSKSTSEIQKDSRRSSTRSGTKGPLDEISSTSKSTSEIQKDSRCFSTRSGTEGPLDEMWHVAGPSSQEPSVEESPKKGSLAAASGESPVLTNAGNIVVKRSGRSFWTFIADIFLRSWGSRTESHTSTAKSAPKSSSNESLNSKAYFTGREPEDDNDENVGKGRRCMPKEPLLPKDSLGQPSKKTTLSQIQEASEMTSSGDEIMSIKADASTSTGTLQRRAAIRSTSSVSGKGDSRRIEVGKGTQAIHLGVVSIDSSLPIVAPPAPSSTAPLLSVGLPSSSSTEPVVLVGHTASSSSGLLKADTAKGEISEISQVEGSRSGFSEIEEPTRGGISEGAGTEVKDGRVKQRKLQRTKQVLKERFDEWEEAFRLEHEQRKVDEMFMREALLEAKKAADTWEVPVGAVLVHNGKIIARGCNLVEDLRDSTAHAEMICIREASNLLRTWRLAETTLYVTLEPCSMCAGAILQSRINAVVWGAPNKLLGADGSWVSLFPSGGEGGGNGPVHPFHPKIKIRRGILATECSDVMQQFFQLRRKQNKQPESPPSSLPVSNFPSKFMSKLHNVFSTMFCL